MSHIGHTVIHSAFVKLETSVLHSGEMRWVGGGGRLSILKIHFEQMRQRRKMKMTIS